MKFGKSLELFFINGRPDEMLTASVFNWTGHILKSPRTQIKDALARPEAQHTGVYLLIGLKDAQPCIYVGESECIADRIKQHDLKKDWWDDAVFITTKANELNKAHVRYLESRLVGLAVKAKSSLVDNATIPTLPKLAEAAVANMEEFIDTLSVVLPAIAVHALTDKKVSVDVLAKDATSTSPEFILANKKHGIAARARLVDGAFVVTKGSQARKTWEGKGGSYASLHHDLVRSGVIDVSGNIAVFVTDYAFGSPSAAAAVCNGRSANGRIEWKEDTSGITYAEWEEIQTAFIAL